MRGISFSAQMIQAIQNTQFDRYPALPLDDPAGAIKCHTRRNHQDVQYHVGRVYYVNEPLIRVKHGAVYEADGVPVTGEDGRQVAWQWQRDRLPAIFMPKYARREWVRIIKVERSTLGAMGVMDLVYEGLLVTNDQMNTLYPDGWGAVEEEKEYRQEWKKLWETLNGRGTCQPSMKVMAYHFERVHEPK